MEIVIPAHIRDVWDTWQVRVMVLLSLTCQIILTISGSRRKQASRSRIGALVWVTYLSADYLATASLGAISSNQGSSGTNLVSLQALWAPFLLLHLGGPDTITAYSLEDNTLWLRQLLGLAVQVMLASNIYLRSWSTNPLTLIAIPLFISGILKYWERNWSLRSAAPEQFGDSSIKGGAVVVAPDIDSELEFLHMGYSLFPLLKRLYSDQSLTFSEGQRSHSFLVVKRSRGRESTFAFKVVEVQLGFLYDMLYTKAPVIYSLKGLVFRLISFLSIVSALVIFVVLADTRESPTVDVWITHALFVGAISLELYASVFVLIPSDWSLQWLTKSRNTRHLSRRNVKWLDNLIKRLSLGEKRWSGCLAQHNLLSFCMKKRVTRCIGSDLPFLMNNDLLYKIHFWLESHWQRTWKDVDDDLKDLIFKFLIENRHKVWAKEGFGYQRLMDLLSHKGDQELKNHRCGEMCGWSVEENEFNRSVLIWHVATDICFYSSSTTADPTREQRVSKTLSDYMVYILLMRPFLLPKWIDGDTHVRDTLREVIRILHGREFPVKDGAEACNMVIQMYRQSHYQPLQQEVKKEKGGKSVLLDGCRLASQLQTRQNLWIVICDVWMEMLTFAASQCEWGLHAQQLNRGGELLTHVCVLMADLGLSKQFDAGEHTSIQSQDEGWGWVKEGMEGDESFLALVHHNGKIRYKTRDGVKFTDKSPTNVFITPRTTLLDLQRSIIRKLGLDGRKRVSMIYYRIPISVVSRGVKYGCFAVEGDNDLQILFHCRRQFSEVRTTELFVEIVDPIASSGGSAPNPRPVNVGGASGSRNQRCPDDCQVASPSFNFNLQHGPATGEDERGESHSIVGLGVAAAEITQQLPHRPLK
ncbi:hypothetical protein PIB30_033518 [Stylosanthes scabra]|uniref:DUF4220 domain-containing protein n=1 Tax=Stylosanthes scabra TaxID=79078 RepID=A0ABU6RCP5_9FABA|nr:hypothetical protein [Stylosanthes scabra]